jgi:hypothetical protein
MLLSDNQNLKGLLAGALIGRFWCRPTWCCNDLHASHRAAERNAAIE